MAHKLNQRTPFCAILSIVLILSFCHPVAASTTLTVPRLFNTNDLPTVGVALVNPTVDEAPVTFRWRTAEGNTLSSTERTIAAKHQFSATLRELFPTLTQSGWLSVESDGDHVTGFWLAGDFVTSTDGAAML